MLDLWNFLSGPVDKYLTIFAIAWSFVGTIMNAAVALGSIDKIIFIDEQLAKNIDKLYWPNGDIRNPLYSRIANRLFYYWLAYPFIYKRSKTKSIKFKMFMAYNSLGVWVLIFTIITAFMSKYHFYL